MRQDKEGNLPWFISIFIWDLEKVNPAPSVNFIHPSCGPVYKIALTNSKPLPSNIWVIDKNYIIKLLLIPEAFAYCIDKHLGVKTVRR